MGANPFIRKFEIARPASSLFLRRLSGICQASSDPPCGDGGWRIRLRDICLIKPLSLLAVAQHFAGLGIDQVNASADRARQRLVDEAIGFLGRIVRDETLHAVAGHGAMVQKCEHKSARYRNLCRNPS